MLDVIDEIWIPPYEGRAVYLRAGQELRLIDVEGKQVGDFVCFRADDPEEFVSPVHMRACLSRLRLKTGDFLYSNRRRPLMRLVEDRVGRHDFLFPACDRYRYEVDFGVKNHPNCRDNLLDALRAAGRPSGF
ncbi:MAG: urea carboxylase-associated family protein, partial [Kyrpidia sp.]|nr:urea carboxylase-associated family protein [Kyrpidia sp.]